MKTIDGYSKEKFTDDHVLLAGGSAKALSDFIGALSWDSTNKKIKYTPVGGSATDLVTLSWDNISGKPSTFSPSTHNHGAGDITSGTLGVDRGGTGKASWTKYGVVYASDTTTLAQTSLPTWAASTTYVVKVVTNASKVPSFSIGTLSWDNITGKPTTFEPATHSHSNYVTFTGDEEISGAKTFQAGKWILKASESNEITSQTWANSTYYKFDDSAVVQNLSGMTNSIKFRWYSDYWNIGVVRGSSSESLGFAIGLQNSGNTHVLDLFRVNKDGTGYLKGNEILTTASTIAASSVAWDNITGKPNRAGSDSDGGPAQTVKGAYTSNGGKQNPNYFGTNKVGFLMMNTTVNNNSQYKDWIIMDCYSGNDVGGGVAFGVNRQNLGAYIMRSASARTSWAESAELIGTHNYTTYTVKKDGTGASGSWGISVTGSAGSVAWGNITGKPDSFTASTHNHALSDINSGFGAAYRIIYSTSATATSTLAANTTTTKKFLTMTGTGSAGAAPTWGTVSWSDVGSKPSSFTPATHSHDNYVVKTGDTMSGTLNSTSTTPFQFYGNGDGTYTRSVMYVNSNGITFETPRATDASNGTSLPFMIKTRGGQFAQIQASGFKKDGSDDTYVLLGGGGHKAISGTWDISISGNADTVDNLHGFPLYLSEFLLHDIFVFGNHLYEWYTSTNGTSFTKVTSGLDPIKVMFNGKSDAYNVANKKAIRIVFNNMAWTSAEYLIFQGSWSSASEWGTETYNIEYSADNSTWTAGDSGTLDCNAKPQIIKIAYTDQQYMRITFTQTGSGTAVYVNNIRYITARFGNQGGDPIKPYTWDDLGRASVYYATSAGSTSYATSAGTATEANYLHAFYMEDPASCYENQKVKWFAAVPRVSGTVLYAGTTAGFPVSNNANGILWLGTHDGTYGGQLGVSSNGSLYYRYISNNTFPTTTNGGSWNRLLFSTDTILYYDYYTTNPNIDTLLDQPYLLTVGETGNFGSGTKPSGTSNAVGIFNIHTHTGNYYSQLLIDSQNNRLWVRSAYNQSTYDNWKPIPKIEGQCSENDALYSYNASGDIASTTLLRFNQTLPTNYGSTGGSAIFSVGNNPQVVWKSSFNSSSPVHSLQSNICAFWSFTSGGTSATALYYGRGFNYVENFRLYSVSWDNTYGLLTLVIYVPNMSPYTDVATIYEGSESITNFPYQYQVIAMACGPRSSTWTHPEKVGYFCNEYSRTLTDYTTALKKLTIVLAVRHYSIDNYFATDDYVRPNVRPAAISVLIGIGHGSSVSNNGSINGTLPLCSF